MNTSEQINELAGALAKAQGAIENAEKDRVNPHLGNRYMTLTSVWDAIRKPLSENGLSVVQVTDATESGLVVLITRLMHASGQYIEATYPVLGMENRGVNAAQAAGSALTYARRYSLTSLVGVVADEDDDAGSATGKQGQKPPIKQPAAKPTTEQPKPAAQRCICTQLADGVPNPDCPMHGAGFKDIRPQPKPAAQPSNGKQAQAKAQPAADGELPFRPSVEGAIEWACKTAPQVWPVDSKGVIVKDVVERSFRKLMTDGLTGRPLMDAWIAKVEDKVKDSQKPPVANAAADEHAEPDGDWLEEPQFS